LTVTIVYALFPHHVSSFWVVPFELFWVVLMSHNGPFSDTRMFLLIPTFTISTRCTMSS